MTGNKWQISDELREKMAPPIPENKTITRRECTVNVLIIALQ